MHFAQIVVQRYQGRRKQSCWLIKKSSEKAKLENPELKKHLLSARESNVVNSQRQRSFTNPHSRDTRILSASRTSFRFRQYNSNLCQICWPASPCSEKVFSQPNAAASNPLPLELRAPAQPQKSSSITDHHSVALFS